MNVVLCVLASVPSAVTCHLTMPPAHPYNSPDTHPLSLVVSGSALHPLSCIFLVFYT